jgi:hypothetical protein
MTPVHMRRDRFWVATAKFEQLINAFTGAIQKAGKQSI